MKKATLTIIAMIFAKIAFSQCIDFTVREVVPRLDNFLLTGRYHATTLTEGEEILIYKTINQGITYRFVVGYDEALPTPTIYIINDENKIIFNNKNGETSYDYISKKTERIKIIIKIPETNSPPPKPEGCVSLVIGIKH